MRRTLYIFFLIITASNSVGQNTTDFQTLLDSGKAEFKKQAVLQTPDFSRAFDLLSRAVELQPDNAEVRYFLGYTIDRLNSDDGIKMQLSRMELTAKASEQFQKVNQLQEIYQGEKWVLDPYSKLTSIWGSLALAYLTLADHRI